MRALVTGGAGFIGSNLVDALLDHGDEVTVVDNLATGRLENLDGARRRGIAFHEDDITDAERMRKVFAGARPDIVFHLAAQIDLRTSICAARWKTMSGRAPARFSTWPVDRSSTTVTSSPRSSRASTRLDPMKPAPPVTRARIGRWMLAPGGSGPRSGVHRRQPL